MDDQQAIFSAITTGDQEEILRMLDSGVPVDVEYQLNEDEQSQSEMHYEVHGPQETWNWDDIHVPSEVMTALSHAVMVGNKDIVRCLLGRGASPTSPRNQTSFHWAVRGGDIEMVKLLIEHGADIDWADPEHEDATPLAWAVKENNIDITRLLLEAGCQVNARTAYGGNILYVAIIDESYELVPMLFDHGADPSMLNDSGRHSPEKLVVLACQKDRSISLDILELIYRKSLDLGVTLTDTEETAITAKKVQLLSHKGMLDECIRCLERLPPSVYTYSARVGAGPHLRSLMVSMAFIMESAANAKNNQLLAWIMESELPFKSYSLRTIISGLVSSKQHLQALLFLVQFCQVNPSTVSLLSNNYWSQYDIIGYCLYFTKMESDGEDVNGHNCYLESNHAALLQLDTKPDRLSKYIAHSLSIKYLEKNSLPLLQLQHATGADLYCLRQGIDKYKEENGNENELPDAMKWVEKTMFSVRKLEELCVIQMRKTIGDPLLEKVSNMELSCVYKHKIMLRDFTAAVL